MNTLQVLSKFYYLNPRWLYLTVTVVLIIPLTIALPMPRNEPSVGARGLYKAVGECPPEKVILIDSSWDLGSKPECMSQLEAFVNDLCKRKRTFVVFSTGLYAPAFANQVIQPIAKTNGYVYGQDWVNLGYIPPPGGNVGVLIQALCIDVHKTRPVDMYGTPVTDKDKLPLMQKVKTAEDIYMVFAVNYTSPLEWMSFGKSQYGLLVAFGCAAIMAPYYYIYVDSGQMCGLLTGNRGAYEYETLTGVFGMGRKVMMTFAFGLCFIIAAVLLGNLGFWAAARVRKSK